MPHARKLRKLGLGMGLGAVVAGTVFTVLHNHPRPSVPEVATTETDVPKVVSKPLVQTTTLSDHRVKTPHKAHKLTYHEASTSTVTAIGDRRLDPMVGVWDPGRLRLLNPYITVSGIVTEVIHEPSDADYHIELVPDKPFKHLLDSVNDTLLHGNLVVEVIPLDDGKVPIPHVGEHVSATGAYVIDSGHGWTEIHPAWLIDGHGSPSYTQAQLLHSEDVINESHDKLVQEATIRVIGYQLTTKPGGQASVTIQTVPYSGATAQVDYGGRQHIVNGFADEEGYVSLTWRVPNTVAPGRYSVVVRTYIHQVQLTLVVSVSNGATPPPNPPGNATVTNSESTSVGNIT